MVLCRFNVSFFFFLCFKVGILCSRWGFGRGGHGILFYRDGIPLAAETKKARRLFDIVSCHRICVLWLMSCEATVSCSAAAHQ